MSHAFVERSGLQVAAELADFLERDALPDTGIPADSFWEGTAAILARFAPENRDLLKRRDVLQAQLDSWFAERKGAAIDPSEQAAFLRAIGYLVGIGMTLALFLHMGNGVRHLFLDTGALFELRRNKLSSLAVLALGATATILFWFYVGVVK